MVFYRNVFSFSFSFSFFVSLIFPIQSLHECAVRRARKRTQIVAEILDTERTYVQALQVIVGVRDLLMMMMIVDCVGLAWIMDSFAAVDVDFNDIGVYDDVPQVFLNPLRSATSGPSPIIDTLSLTQVTIMGLEL